MSEWTIYYLNTYVPFVMFLAVLFVGMRWNAAQLRKTREHQVELVTIQKDVLATLKDIRQALEGAKE